MMIYGAIFILLFGLLPCNHAFEIVITEPIVVTKTEDFKSRQTSLECSSTQPHEYCCWNTPEISDCQCREKKCVQGVQVSSDEHVCKITIDHSEAMNMAGLWSCTLLANVLQNEGSNATSELFLVDLNEVCHDNTYLEFRYTSAAGSLLYLLNIFEMKCPDS